MATAVEYQTHNQETICLMRTQPTATNFQQFANIPSVQANSASTPQQDGK